MWYRSPRVGLASLVLLAALAVVPILSAGPLDPPPGAVEPTSTPVWVEPLVQNGSVTVSTEGDNLTFVPGQTVTNWYQARQVVTFDDPFDGTPRVQLSLVSSEFTRNETVPYDYWLQQEQVSPTQFRVRILVASRNAQRPEGLGAVRVSWLAIGRAPREGSTGP